MDKSKLKKLKPPQNDLNPCGNCMGYRVATLDSICRNQQGVRFVSTGHESKDFLWRKGV
jgi:hypothetical protein